MRRRRRRKKIGKKLRKGNKESHGGVVGHVCVRGRCLKRPQNRSLACERVALLPENFYLHLDRVPS